MCVSQAVLRKKVGGKTINLVLKISLLCGSKASETSEAASKLAGLIPKYAKQNLI
jgi:hypothetical protein